MLDYDAFKPHQMTLTPHQPVRFKDCRSIAYMTGDLPSVILHIGGDKYELFPGQCIPTGGTVVMIENPYERHGLCEFTLNAKPQPMADMRALPGSRQSEYVTYNTRASLAAPAYERNMGVGIHLWTGRARVTISGAFFDDGWLIPGLEVGALGNRPADMLPSVVQNPQHSSGAEFPRCSIRSGTIATKAENDLWLQPYGLTWGDWGSGVNVSPDNSGTVTIDMQSGAFLALWGKKAPATESEFARIKIEDFGEREGKAHA